jgi:hypothetical protein
LRATLSRPSHSCAVPRAGHGRPSLP